VIQSRPAMSAILIALLSGSLLAAQDSKPLPTPPSPGKAIQDASQAAAHDHPKFGNVEILTDTQGVDFGPYLQDVMSKVRKSWYDLIPSDAVTKKGKVAIEFAIQKDGRIAAMKIVAASGDVSLDRAAWGGITASNPLPALPSAFTGPYLALRVRFYYNPTASDLNGDTASRSVGDSVVHAAVLQDIADSNQPNYPKKALSDKVEGVVRLDVEIDPDGKVRSVYSSEGNLILAEAASQAIHKWRFHPAQINGKPVEDKVRIKVEFRLDGERIRTEVVWPETPPSVTPAP